MQNDIITNWYYISIVIVLSYSLLGWLVLFGGKVNYGRLLKSLIHIYIPAKISWFIFELPNLLWCLYFIIEYSISFQLGYILFLIHYINRDIIYPFYIMSTNNTKMPLQILISALLFTTANGYLQCYANKQSKFNDNLIIQFIGIGMFILGMIINIYSDVILQKTKNTQRQKQTKQKYIVIYDFWFKYISNPNYLGEIIEWIGYAIVCGTYESLLFVFSTISVLIPAAIVRNNWNLCNIVGYPRSRKAIIPYIL